MVRIGGMQYACRPDATMGQRISNMTLRGKPLDPERRYKVASWAPVTEGVTGEPVWNVVVQYIKSHETIRTPAVNRPAVLGVAGDDAGISTAR